jgi:hypothetical protein
VDVIRFSDSGQARYHSDAGPAVFYLANLGENEGSRVASLVTAERTDPSRIFFAEQMLEALPETFRGISSISAT